MGSGNGEVMDRHRGEGSAGLTGCSRGRALLSWALFRAAAVGVCVAACSGCGSERRFVEPLAVKEGGSVRFLASRPPASTAPGLGPANLVFLSERVGFVATTGGGFEEEKVGYIGPRTSGLIERTVDGGVSWRVVLRAPRVVFEQITFADRLHGVALGNIVRAQSCCEDPPQRPIGYATDDGGRLWHRLRVPAALAGGELDLPAASAWYGVGDRLLFSGDEGRTWTPRSLPNGPRGPSGLGPAVTASAVTAFPSPSIGFVAAAAPCGEQLFETTDGAHSWAPLAGTCASSYSSIDFLDARTGWAVTGAPFEHGPDLQITGRPVIRFTDDGGATWKTVSRGNDWPLDTHLYFTDLQHGWAVSTADYQGFAYDSVHRTIDGGYRWRTVRYPLLPSAFAGPGSAWAGSQCCGPLYRTTDGGRSWQLRVQPANVSPTLLMLATRSTLVINSLAGALRSNDQGRTWSSTPAPSPRAVARALREPIYLRVGESSLKPIAELNRTATRTWRALSVPMFMDYGDIGDAAFTDGKHGLIAAGQAVSDFDRYGTVPVFATHDAGATWKRVRVPKGVAGNTPVTLGPGVVVIEGPRLLYLSTDEGRHWATIPIRNNFWQCGVSRPQQAAIWLLCAPSVSNGPVLLLRSDDGGLTWRKLTGRTWLDPRLIALNGQEAWAIAMGQPVTNGSALWHTTDGGGTWREIWPNIPGATLIRDRRSFGPTLPGPEP